MGASNYPDLSFPKGEPFARTQKTKRKKKTQQKTDAYAQVDKRDKLRCQLTGARGDTRSLDPLDRLHHHHIIEASQGGPDESWNLVTVSRTVHDLLTEHRITVWGNADDKDLTWTVRQNAVVEVFGRRKVPLGVCVVADADWEAFIRTVARTHERDVAPRRLET